MPDDNGAPGNQDPIAQFLHELLVKLVDVPDQVAVRVLPGNPTLYEATVAPEDVGQVVGREGRIVKSIRTLVAAAGQKRGERATFEIADGL
ncbi:MAG: KH domain-containing protein [Candidatus Eiseniibacteriota bacterium]